MANLLRQTEEILNNYGKAWSDICWIGIPEGSEVYWMPDAYGTVPIENFKEMADREYDDGYGGAEVNTHLIIAGDDWWLERGEYDGSEWWEFKTMPKKPEGSLTKEAVWDKWYWYCRDDDNYEKVSQLDI